ncbi:DEAD/DEAH box helicase family protein [Mariniblastus fucicola]|uniref:DEAD/DEAH box helicase family protein n=1 Tax=Mariniblastus fucicola TaxID=980251 RepID=UPI0021BC0E1C|nr:DEAD/DEAH box helicase family protein [Mariniblastus fucicola]
MSFKGNLRPSQAEVVEIARRQLATGQKQLHIVAPPGSGKTVLGLWLWAELIQQRCLVLSPNSAIQSQWAARTDLFKCDLSSDEMVSTDPQSPSLLTSLTYQSVTMPARKNDLIDEQAIELWAQTLIEEGQAMDVGEANVWIDDLRTHNEDYFRKRFGSYRKKIRDEASMSGESVSLLHPSSQATLQRLADQGVGVLILDECHHLLGHWGRVLSDALEILSHPVVIGLTATPPDTSGKDARDVQRYEKFFGEVDFQVPVPAVVKDGFLAPYQDLAWFVRPTDEELKFVASVDRQLEGLIEEVCVAPKSSSTDVDVDEAENVGHKAEIESDAEQPLGLIQWLGVTLESLRLPTGEMSDWKSFSKRDPQFSLASRQFLASRNQPLPENVPELPALDSHESVPGMEYIVPVLDRYVRHYLRRSPLSVCHDRATQLTESLRLLGTQITETGSRACVSPVGRVMAWSKNKANAIVPILRQEIDNLGDSIRAVVIADFEKTSAVSTELRDLMDEETGGAIAAFKVLLSDEKTDSLEPILLTGSTILIDDEIEAEFLQQSQAWLAERELQVELTSSVVADFRQISGSGRDWSPRVYVEMITEHFQRGLTQCLVGTRGLLGEGWDANRINVLIDLTTVTTSMSINQLRGRSFRLDPGWKEKLANNWDVVCVASEFNKGFDDYRRFCDKHKNLFGVTDDSAIEKGVGHVHPAFTEIKPEGIEKSVSVINAEMLERSRNRDGVRETWKIGEPFRGEAVSAIELKMPGSPGGFPPFSNSTDAWTSGSLTEAIGNAVLASLTELKLVQPSGSLATGQLVGNYVRVFLQNATLEDSQIFSNAMKQILGPLDRPRYMIPRSVDEREQTFLSRILPGIIGKYFVKSKNVLARLHAVPDALCKNKSAVSVFQKHWNEHVSPGDAIFAQRGEGAKTLEDAKAEQKIKTVMHEKEIFH